MQKASRDDWPFLFYNQSLETDEIEKILGNTNGFKI